MSTTLKVALLQLRARDLEQHDLAFEELLAAIDVTAAGEPDLIVLPEASYPAYFLRSREAYDAAGVRPDAEVEAALGERAKRIGCSIVAGLVQRGADGRLVNASVHLGPDGKVRERYAKSFLWHFDTTWFTPGERFPLSTIGEASAGMLICADGRLPEIARTYAVGGARVLVDPTAWVAAGRRRDALGSIQVDALLPARAIENGVWIVAADKVGVEAGTLVYAGRSGVVNPRGEWVVQAPSDQPGIVTHELDLDEAGGPPVARRPVLYADASMPGAKSEAVRLAREPLTIEDAAARVGAVALDPAPSAVELMERCRAIVRALAAQDCALIVLPDFAGSDTRAVTQQEFLSQFKSLSQETGTLLAVGLAERDNGSTYKTLYLLDHGTLLATHRQTHLDAREREAGFSAGDTPPPVVETAVGYLGLLLGSEGLVPELARSLKLRGTEFLLWSAGTVGAPLRVLARTRAVENRLYAVVAGYSDVRGGGYVVDPNGAPLGEALEDEQMGASADVNRALARWNDMAPHTNPILNRPIEAFAPLFR